MNQIKFSRVKALPAEGKVGGLYFVYGGQNPCMYLCTAPGVFEPYTIQEYVESELPQNTEQDIYVEGDTLYINNPDVAFVQNSTLKISPIFASIDNNKLIYNYGTN